MFHHLVLIDEHGNPELHGCCCDHDTDHDSHGERVDR